MTDKISMFDRGRIIGMWENDTALEVIAQRIPCCVKTVRKWVKRWQENGEEGLADKRRYNKKPRVTTAEQDLALIRQVNIDPSLPLSHSLNELGLQISDRTARRRLKEANAYYRAEQKQWVSDKEDKNKGKKEEGEKVEDNSEEGRVEVHSQEKNCDVTTSPKTID